MDLIRKFNSIDQYSIKIKNVLQDYLGVNQVALEAKGAELKLASSLSSVPSGCTKSDFSVL